MVGVLEVGVVVGGVGVLAVVFAVAEVDEMFGGVNVAVTAVAVAVAISVEVFVIGAEGAEVGVTGDAEEVDVVVAISVEAFVIVVEEVDVIVIVIVVVVVVAGVTVNVTLETDVAHALRDVGDAEPLHYCRCYDSHGGLRGGPQVVESEVMSSFRFE